MTQVIRIPSPSAFLDSSVDDQTHVSGPRPHWQQPNQMSTKEEHASGPVNCPASSKPKQTKSRNGCVTCKLKRLKCDEKKPGCDQCAKRNVTCGGYKKDFKWRPFEEQNVSIVVKQSSSSASASASASVPAAAGAVASSLPSKPKPAPKAPPRQSKSSIKKPNGPTSTSLPERSRPSVAQRPIRKEASNSHSYSTANSYSLPSTVPSLPTFGYETSSDPSPTMSPENDSLDAPLQASYPDSQEIPFFEQSPLSFPATAAPQFLDSFWSNSGWQSDGIANPPPGSLEFENFVQPSLWPEAQAGFMLMPGTEMKPSPYDLYATSTRSKAAPISQASNVEPKLEELDDDDIEEIMRPVDSIGANHMVYQSMPDMFAFSNTSDPYWQNAVGMMFREPRLSIDSDEMVIARFERKTCAIMSVKDGPWENPWRTFVQPLMHQHRMIYNVVVSMACLHQQTKYPQLVAKGRDHFAQAFGALKSVGSNNLQVPFDVAFAALLGLAFAESWSSPETTGTDYIKQSRPLMYRAIEECQKAPRGFEHLNRVKFLCRTWIYLDVLSRLTSAVDDDSTEFEEIAKIVSSPTDPEVDPLMGVASTLFPIVGRVANLVRNVCRVTQNTPQLIAQASNLKLELETWQPVPVPEVIQDETCTVDHNMQTALSYKWSTLLYLHQAVPEIPMESCATLADRTIRCLAKVPTTSRSTVVQIYPLLAATCEASTLDDRAWASHRWDDMKLRMDIANVDRCIDTVHEAWRRRDEFASQVAHGSIQSQSFSPSPGAIFPFDQDQNLMPPFQQWTELFPSNDGQLGLETSGLPQSMSSRLKLAALSENDPLTGELRRELTVRGKLHWVGVMKDYNWQVLLG